MSETNVTIINMQPTTDYVNIGGPLINPSEYATKNEINEKLDNYATVKQATDIARNITDSALENGYYTSSEIDGKLDCKSNTDHTHTNIYNDLTINSNSFKLLSSKSKYTTFTMGKNDKNYESAVIGYGDDYMGKYLYMRINGGKQLTLYGDRATLEADLTVTSLNGITPSTISLNTHNHDDKYALVDHTHTTNDVTDIDILAKADHNHDETYSKLEHTHTVSDITDVSTLAKADHNHNYNDIQNNYFKIKTETKQELVDDIYYIVYDASELLNKEQNGAHISEWVKLKIKFLDNIEMIADKNRLTIKVGKKEFIFSESGFFDGTEKA